MIIDHLMILKAFNPPVSSNFALAINKTKTKKKNENKTKRITVRSSNFREPLSTFHLNCFKQCPGRIVSLMQLTAKTLTLHSLYSSISIGDIFQ